MVSNRAPRGDGARKERAATAPVEVVRGVIVGVDGGQIVMRPPGKKQPSWRIPRARFRGAPEPKPGMQVEIELHDHQVVRATRISELPENMQRAQLQGALRGMARSLEGMVRKAEAEGWPIPAVYAEVVARLRAAGEVSPPPEGRGKAGVG
jgi:hypothetical protein